MKQVDDKNVRERAARIKLLLMDCDGVLTDGRLYFGSTGEELKVFHVRDGQGIVDWHEAGFRSGVISGRNSPIVAMRAEQLGIEYVIQGQKKKIDAFNKIIAAAAIDPNEVAYIGDDIPDAEVMPLVGLAVAVGDAVEGVKAVAHYITSVNGGLGAVRELIDLMLRSKS